MHKAVAAAAAEGGGALQQVWLMATAHQLTLHPWTAVPYMIAMLHGPDSHVFNSPERATLQVLDRRLDHLFPE